MRETTREHESLPRPIALGIFALGAGLALLAVASRPILGQEAPAEEQLPDPRLVEEAAEGEGPVVIVRERKVLVPYKELDDVIEKFGRGVFLPYDEFIELWKAARPKPPEPKVDTPPADAVVRGGAYKGEVRGDLARFDVTYVVEGLKDGWSELALPLGNVAVETVKLSDEGALFSASPKGYSLILPRKGTYQVDLAFSTRVTSTLGKKSLTIGIPPVAVSRLELSIPEEDTRVDVVPLMAATRTTTADGATQLLAFVGNATTVTVSWMPPAGKVTEEAAVFFAEQSLKAYVGESTVRLGSQVDFQVVRGEVDRFQIRLPADFRLLSVKGENIREWQPEGDLLTVQLHSAVKQSYRLDLAFEWVLEETPETLTLGLPRAEGVLRQSGWLALSHDAGLKVRVSSSAGLSQLDPEEVPQPLRQDLRVGFRYLAPPPPLELELEKILPLVRSQTTSVITLGREEDEWVGFVDYSISKAGLFKLELVVPTRWSVEEMGDGATVEDYQWTDQNDLRTISVTLKSKALGSFRLPFRLTAEGSASANEATLRPPHVVGSEQDRGILAITAPRSLELTTTAQSGLRSADFQELFRTGIMGRVGEDTGTPLTYTYHENAPETPATVTLAVKSKKVEINVLEQHLVEISDDRVTTTHFLDYEILYKEVEDLQFTAPSELDDLLKIDSRDVKEREKVSSDQGRTLWKVTLQGPTARPVTLTISYEQPLSVPAAGVPQKLPVALVEAAGDIQISRGYVAITRKGTLEINAKPVAMETVDASLLPDKLRRGKVHTALHYFEPQPSLVLELKRYEYQPLARAVVNLLHMQTSVSQEPLKLTTRATLFVQNASVDFLEIELPEATTIHQVTVNGATTKHRKRKEGPGSLIPIPRSAGGVFPVVIVYEEEQDESMGSGGSVTVVSPRVVDREDQPVPVQKIELDLYLPRDYTYLSFDGELKRDAAQIPSLLVTWRRITGQAPAPPAAPRNVQTEAGGGVDFQLPTEGLELYGFEALAPSAKLKFTYTSPQLWFFIKLLALAAVLVGGLLLIHKAHLSRLWVTVAAVAGPLALAWFQTDAWVGFYTWATTGGVVLAVAIVVPILADRFRQWRERRLALAPDPFLEDAPGAGPEAEEEATDEDAGAEEDSETPSEEEGPDDDATARPKKKSTKKRDRKSRSSGDDDGEKGSN